MKYFIILLITLVLSSCHHYKAIPEGNLVVIGCGDSIVAGQKNTAGNAPGNWAARALTKLGTPTSFLNLGVPGETASNFNEWRRQQFLDSLAVIRPGHPVVASFGYGANDLTVTTREKTLANIARAVRWAHDTAHVDNILIIPVLNREDQLAGTVEANGEKSYHFNASRLWLNAQLHALHIPGVHVAKEADSPEMYADDYPKNKVLCADEVHPLDAGAEKLGRGTIAEALRRISRN